MQNYVEGQEICLWAAYKDGKMIASAAYRPIWRNGHSASYVFEEIKCADAIKAAAKIAAFDNITGQLSFDVIITEQGDTIFLECNPRATSGLHLFDANPKLADAIISGSPLDIKKATLRYLSLAMVILGLPRALTSARLGSYCRTWREGRDVLCRNGDYLILIGVMVDALRFIYMGLRKWRDPAAQTTDDIEWNGEPLL